MKYTRYDMKRKNSGNLILVVVLFSTLLFALLIGSVVSNLLLKNANLGEGTQTPSNAVDVVKEGSASKAVKYIAVQGGMFSKPENAENAKNNLSTYGNPFTIQEQNGTRVLVGLYSEEAGLNLMKLLTEKSIDNSKMVFDIKNISSACDEEITAAISAELEVLSKLNDSTVKSIKTGELKKWLSTLEEVDKNSKNIALLDEIKAHINSLPDEIAKDKVPEYYTFLYNFLKKLVTK